jgi:hypothetical protein
MNKVLGGLVAFLFVSVSAFAGINCSFDNIPNGSFPDSGPVRNDLFKFAGLGEGEGAEVGAYWTAFYNLGGSTQPLKIVKIDTFRCPNCFDVYANTLGDAQVTMFKISIRQDGQGNEIYSNIKYRMNRGGPSNWLPFNETPGICYAK